MNDEIRLVICPYVFYVLMGLNLNPAIYNAK